MYSTLFLSLAIFGLVLSSDTESNTKRQAATEISQLFLQNYRILNTLKNGRRRTVPSFLKKLYKMQDFSSTFSQVSCIFSEDQKPSEKRQQFFFDLSNIANFSEANQVQLRVFKRRSKVRNSRDFYYIHLHQIFASNNNTESKRLISSRFVRNSRGEWLAFDVTSDMKSKQSLLTTKLSFSFEVKAVKPQSKSRPVSIAKYGRKQPFVLIFFKKSHKHLQTSDVAKADELSLDQFPFGKLRFPRAATYLDKPNDLCSRKPLHIDFQKLGITSIIAPQSYQAYYCDGTCPIYSGDPNQSVYSFLRNRYRLESGEKIPAACCVPTELKSVMIMYFNAQGNINVARFQGMAVSLCGCR